MVTAYEGAWNAVSICMGVKSKDRVLVVTDNASYKVGELIEQAANNVTKKTSMYILEDFGERPLKLLPAKIQRAIKKSNVTFWAAESLGDELGYVRIPFYKLAIRYARHAHMPGVTLQMLEQGMGADYDKVYKLTNHLHEIVKNVKKIEIENPVGTDLRVQLNPEWTWKPCHGIYHKKGDWGNLPEGELFTAGFLVNGHMVVDELGDFFSKEYGILTRPEKETDTPLYLDVVDSRVDFDSIECDIPGLKEKLITYLKFDENSNRAGEVAIPTNEYVMGLPLIGDLLQDEKARVHVAFGNPYKPETGADWDSKKHLDMLMKKCTVWIDGTKIMENDKYLFEF